MDYSENLSQQYKYEPQASHFNKNQYSLHCTVKHTDNKNSPYEYIYHLSNEKKHDFAFTSMVVNQNDDLLCENENVTEGMRSEQIV